MFFWSFSSNVSLHVHLIPWFNNQLYNPFFRNCRRSEINQSELKFVVVHQERDEGEGEKERESEKHTTCADSSEVCNDDEVQRSLISKKEDDSSVESWPEGNREDTSVPKRTVLHTYSVFISNVGAGETHQFSI